MANYAVHICAPFCTAECRHGVPCVIFNDEKHPRERGHLRHFGDDGEMHEWSGAKGRCTVGPYPDEDWPPAEPMMITVVRDPEKNGEANDAAQQ